MKLYTLNSDTENKVVQRDTRIFADTLFVNVEKTFSVITDSRAKRLKIKLFLDAVRYRYLDTNNQPQEKVFRYGQYIEMEHGEYIYIINANEKTPEKQKLPVFYTCSENTGEGNFSVTIKTDLAYDLYFSNVNFEDSFFNPDSYWYNPDNPNNLISETVPEPINPAIGLPNGGTIGDALVNNAPGSAEWISKQEFYNTGPKGDDVKFGTVKVDGQTVKSTAGVVYLPLDNNTIKLNATTKVIETTLKTDNSTINLNANTLSLPLDNSTITVDATSKKLNVPLDNSTLVVDAVTKKIKCTIAGGGGGGLNYTLTEQDTGLKWTDGATVYQRTFLGTATGTVILTGIKTIVNANGILQQTATPTAFHPFEYIHSTLYGYLDFNTGTGAVKLAITGVTLKSLTVRYTKL